jgi:type VI secretion system secreted protein VgrG
MISFTQAGSPLVASTTLEPDLLLATGISGREGLNRGFEFTVTLLAKKGSEIPFRQILGQPLGLRLKGPDAGGVFPQRLFHGLVFEFSKHAQDQVFDHYTAVIRPRLEILGLSRRSRVFQDLSAKDILTNLVEPVGGAEFKVFGDLRHRNYCVQYQETDLDFFRRICSEEGLTFFWTHEEHNHKLVITNRTSLTQSLGKVHFNPNLGGPADFPVLTTWTLSQRLTTAGVEVNDRHFQLFGTPLNGSAKIPKTIEVGATIHFLDLTGKFTREDGLSSIMDKDGVDSSGNPDPAAIGHVFEALDDRAKIASIAVASQAIRGRGEGLCPHLEPGRSFDLVDQGEQDGGWLVVGMDHHVTIEGAFWAGEPARVQANHQVEAAPIALEQATWPPLPKPKVGGVLTALVTGPEGRETFVDEYGRVQLRFLWEGEETSGARTSCWVRVAQSWAGKGYGTFFWPRIGNEVVVAFENGDPDRPIVIGSVYNSQTGTPLALPALALVQGLRTRLMGSAPGERAHSLVFSDDPSEPIVHLKSNTMFLVHQRREQQNSSTDTQFNIRG